MSRVSFALATVGVAVFSLILAIPAQSAARVAGPAAASESAAALFQAAPVPETEPVVEPHPLAIPRLPASPAAPPAPPPVAVLAVANAPSSIVIASWYGPGFYGNRTACGQVYTPEILGVAHRTLPCGTLLRLEYGGRAVTVPVIDRGPFIAGRTLDLSNATRAALGCTDLCPLRMQ